MDKHSSLLSFHVIENEKNKMFYNIFLTPGPVL